MGRITTTDFVLDTVGHCFICMEEMSPQPAPPGSSSSICSMLYLSRYLKIKMKKVFNEDVPIPEHLLTKVEMSTLKVSLCEECASWNSRLSEVLRKLEKIEIEAASYLQLIHSKFKRAAQDEKIDICSKLALADRCSDSDLMGKLEVAEALRKETMEKCSQKLKEAQLKVKIQKLSEKDIEILKQPKSSCNFEKSTGVNSERCLDDVKFETSNSEGIWESENDYLDNFEEQNEDSTQGNVSQSLEYNSGSISPKDTMFLKQKYVRNSQTWKYDCKLCAKTFAHLSGFYTHYQNIHLKIRFKCKICNKEFTQLCHLKTHQKSVHVKLRVKCQSCNAWFSSPVSRQHHIRLKRCKMMRNKSSTSKQQDPSSPEVKKECTYSKLEVVEEEPGRNQAS